MRLCCPAARDETGTLATEQGVRCGIAGVIQNAEGSPCAVENGSGGHYAGVGGPLCPIWRDEKQRYWANRHPERAERMIGADGWA